MDKAATEPGKITQRRLSTVDLTQCLALSDEARWNQTAEDWRMIMAQGAVMGLFSGSRLVASAALLPYGERIGWICMVLVTAAARRRGYATRLMRWAIDEAQERRLIAGLDATPDGREVYRHLGFEDVYPLTRLQGHGLPRAEAAGDGTVRNMTPDDLHRIARLDQTAFGADRSALLKTLHGRAPHLALVAGEEGAPKGYALGRDGRLATQIGPVVATDPDAALALVAAALRRVEGPAFIDLGDAHAPVHEWLLSAGFTRQRSFTRMLMARNAPLDDPRQIIAIAGPELA